MGTQIKIEGLASANLEEQVKIDRFLRFAVYMRARVSVGFELMKSGRVVMARGKHNDRKFRVLFHIFDDKAYLDDERRPYKGSYEMADMVERIRNRPPPVLKPQGPRRTRPYGFHQVFKK